MDPDGTTPLVRAIWNSHYDTARVLIEAGADPNLADSAGMGALYAAVDMSSLGEVYGMPPRKVNDTSTPLDVISLLLDKGADVDAKLKSAALQRNHTPGEPQLGAGTTPLMRAARNGDFRAMQLLVARGRRRVADAAQRHDRADAGVRASAAAWASSPRTSAPRPTCWRA